MKAAVRYEFGMPSVVEEVRIDPPQQGEVKVRVRATAVCHSVIHLLRGEWGMETPVIAGHEAAGVVAEVGEGIADVEPGDPVLVSLLRSCGSCCYSSVGCPHLCEGKFALSRESRLRSARGETIQHGTRTGAFAEGVIVDQSQMVAVPDTMPLDQATLLGCGVITGYGAVVNTAGVRANSSIVVIGVGGVAQTQFRQPLCRAPIQSWLSIYWTANWRRQGSSGHCIRSMLRRIAL
jgi:S-(hydroxymethyl)glutathione dehydrogenase/alcohol dehydrogenase